jgi:4-amino-4-deoxy-L-arabinose transferase-like glycosyltransferase
LHEPGRIDEFYAVPGWTILHTGLPQLPHFPSRSLTSVFYKADEVLYAEPPLYFYVQALFYCFLPVNLATARIPSLLSGIGVLALVYELTRRWTGTSLAAFWAAALCSLSRWFIYGVTLARADLACTLCGLAAIWMMDRRRETPHVKWILAAGVLIGLGGLTHPFAIVYAVQLGVWVALASRGWRRLGDFVLLTAATLAVFALWIPLILVDPEVFRVQFYNQFLNNGRGGDLSWLADPGHSLWYHVRYLWLIVGAWQCVLALVPLLVATPFIWRRPAASLALAAGLTWSAFVLMSLAVGSHHDVPGYWSYPGGLAFILTGWFLAGASSRLRSSSPELARFFNPLCALLLLALMLPGSSLRILQAAVTHWSDVNYNAPAFAQQVLAEIPADARCTVDGEYVLDFLAAGRKTLGVPTETIYFDADRHPYDYLILSRYGLRMGLASRYCAEKVKSLGVEQDPFACYIEIYRPAATPCPPEAPQEAPRP